MYEDSLTKYLRKLNGQNNPFTNKNFYIVAQETDICNGVHRILNIELEYKQESTPKCIINYKNDYIAAFYIYTTMVFNVFAYYPKHRISLIIFK